MGEAGGAIPHDFRYRQAARQLGIPYTQIDTTPVAVLEAAYQDWEAIRAAGMRLFGRPL